jgi:hypothetical protein
LIPGLGEQQNKDAREQWKYGEDDHLNFGGWSVGGFSLRFWHF